MLTGFFQDSEFVVVLANRIRIRIPTSWIRTGVGLEKTWVRAPL